MSGAAPIDPGERPDVLATSMAGSAAIRGGVLRVAGYALGVLLSVGSAAVLFRHLGVADGGRYVTVLALVATVQGLTDFGLTAIGIRELAAGAAHRREQVLRALLGLRLGLTAGGVGAAVLFAGAAGYEGAMVVGAALAGLGLVIQNQQTTLATELMVELRLGWITALELLRQAISVALIFALVVAGASLVAFLAVPIPAATVVFVLTLMLVHGRIPIVPRFDMPEWRALLRDVLPFAAATAIGSVYFRLAIVLLSLIASADETGYYAASFRVVEVLVVVPQLVVTAAFPIFARAARDDRSRLGYGVQRLFEACALLGGWLTLCLVLGAGFIIEIVAGPDFAPSVPVLRIQAITVFAIFLSSVWSYALLSLREHRALLTITCITLIVNCVLVLLLGEAHGARGAAVATLAADVAGTIGLGLVLARRHRELRPQLQVLISVTAAGAAAGSLALLPGLPDLILIAAATLIYGGVLLLLRAVPEELLIELRRLRGAPES